jgi:DNA polymerase III gamma/tau subunit
MLSVEPEQRAADHAFAARIGKENLLRFRSVIADAYKEARDVGLPRLWLEVTLLRLIQETAVPIVEKVVNKTQARAAVAGPEPAALSSHPMQEKWDATIADIQAHVAKVWPLISGTSVAGVDGNTVRIQFPRGFQHERLMAKDEVRRRILERFQKVMGSDQWRLEFIPASEKPEETEPEAVKSPLQGEPLANAVQELFGVQPEN